MRETHNDAVEYIYTAFITLKNGKRIYASQYGLKAFCIPVKNSKITTTKRMLAVSSFSFFERMIV